MTLSARHAGADILDDFSGLDLGFAELDRSLVFRLSDGPALAAVPGQSGLILAGDLACGAEASLSSADLLLLLKRAVGLQLLLLTGRMGISGDKIAARTALAQLLGQDFRPAPAIARNGLPGVTTDIERARSDLRTWGYCLIGDALDPVTLDAIRTDVVSEASLEVAEGYASHEGGASPLSHGIDAPNQRLHYLINRSDVLRNLLLHPHLDELLEPELGPHFTSFGFTAIISGPGGRAQPLHYDQLFIQPPVSFPAFFNVGWFLDDVTAANGGTRILPGSHLWDGEPADPTDISDTIAAEGPAGTMLIFDGRLWHGGGANISDGRRHILFTPMARPFLRPQDNFFLLLEPDVEEGLCPKLKERLGYRVTNLMGSVGPPVEGRIVGRNERRVSRHDLLVAASSAS